MMENVRIKCIECDNMILPSTAEANGGLCGQCVKVSESLRKAQRAFNDRLASGIMFAPTQLELASSKQPAEIGSPATHWNLEPDYYRDSAYTTVNAVIGEATQQTKDYVFLVSDSGSRLNLSFNTTYGVIEYQNESTGDFRYAYTRSNLRMQVTEEFQISQACPCCGVGMLWYPSRCHMPRLLAFEIIAAITSTTVPTEVDWLEYDDISYISPGRG